MRGLSPVDLRAEQVWTSLLENSVGADTEKVTKHCSDKKRTETQWVKSGFRGSSKKYFYGLAEKADSHNGSGKCGSCATLMYSRLSLY